MSLRDEHITRAAAVEAIDQLLEDAADMRNGDYTAALLVARKQILRVGAVGVVTTPTDAEDELAKLRHALWMLSGTEDPAALGTTSAWWRERVAEIAARGVVLPEPPQDRSNE